MQEAKYLAADAERKYEEVARKLNMMENDLDKALLKADNSENKIIDLEMELKVVGDNMKCMEVIFTIIVEGCCLIVWECGWFIVPAPSRSHKITVKKIFFCFLNVKLPSENQL